MRNDIERILIDEAVIEKRLDSMAFEIERDFPSGTLVVIILLKGALVFAADLLRRVPRRWRSNVSMWPATTAAWKVREKSISLTAIFPK